MFDVLVPVFNMQQQFGLYDPSAQILIPFAVNGTESSLRYWLPTLINTKDRNKSVLHLTYHSPAAWTREYAAQVLGDKGDGLVCFHATLAGTGMLNRQQADVDALPYRQAVVRHLGIREEAPRRPVITILNKKASVGRGGRVGGLCDTCGGCGCVPVGCPIAACPPPSVPVWTVFGLESKRSLALPAASCWFSAWLSDASVLFHCAGPVCSNSSLPHPFALLLMHTLTHASLHPTTFQQGRRMVENFREVAKIIRTRYPHSQVNVVDFGKQPDLTMRQQVQLMADTSILISPCGGLATVLTFLRPQSTGGCGVVWCGCAATWCGLGEKEGGA